MPIFTQISLIIVLAAVVSGIARLLKQPIIIGYILTGLIVGPGVLGLLTNNEPIQIFSEMGIAILLFIVGLSLSPKEVEEVGSVSLIVGIVQIVVTAALGFVLSTALGFATIPSIYIAVALTFSSTIIVLKLLSDKGELETLHGRIAIGVLLVQDIAATIALIVVSTFSHGGSVFSTAIVLFGKGIILTVVLALISINILPRLSKFFAKSQEFLFVFSLGWGFGIAALFGYLGFSIEIGALLAGVTLSMSPYSEEVGARLKPLRDFFVIMFFILLGVRLDFSNFGSIFFAVVVLSLFVFVVKPLVILLSMVALKYGKKPSFKAGSYLSQLSEFSLILIILGISVGHLNDGILSLITIVGLITIAGSSYFVMFMDQLYPIFSKYFAFLDRGVAGQEQDLLSSYKVVLFGANRAGYDFVKRFKDLGQAFLVVDFDPDVISILTKMNINCRYGDADDSEFLATLNLAHVGAIVSTIPDFETNVFLLKKVRQVNQSAVVIVMAYSIKNAFNLYNEGASYVIMPHFIGGHFISQMLQNMEFDHSILENERNEHMTYLKERQTLGHEHPHKR